VQSLDVLRAVAVLLVIGNHLTVPSRAGPISTSVLALWQRGGWIGVAPFFVLSAALVVALVAASRHRRDPLSSIPHVFVGVALLAPAFVFPRETYPSILTIGYTAFFLGSGLLLMATVRRGIPSHPVVTVLGWMGAGSCSIYLWHMFAIGTANRLLGELGIRAGSVHVATAIVGATLVGVAMATAVEMPVLKLRDRFFPSRLAQEHAPAARISRRPSAGQEAASS
jgi:peptidoglycan/LPS O-acetylase OafA/YrhL